MLSITNAVRRLLARPATPSRPTRPCRRLRLECLEERTLLSGWATPTHGTNATDRAIEDLLRHRGRALSRLIRRFENH